VKQVNKFKFLMCTISCEESTDFKQKVERLNNINGPINRILAKIVNNINVL
jgi:hypothetical protein